MTPEIKCKLLSGRWLLTLITGISFLGLTVAYVIKGAEHSISGEAIAAIITAVFTSYFHKDRANGKAKE